MKGIAKILLEDGIIQKEEEQIFDFGLRQLRLGVINVVSILVVGVMLGTFIQITIFMIAYIILRSYAGGYHAKTATRCYFLSMASVIGMVFIIKLYGANVVAILFVNLISAYYIFRFAPIETAKKKLDEKERTIYRCNARKILIGEGILCIGGAITKYDSLFYGLTMSLVLVCFFMFLEQFFICFKK